MRVSVICPVFDTRPDELRAAVRSALDQDGQDVHEIILVDDASTNSGTLDALAELAAGYNHVSLLRLDRNGGPAVARNAGLSRASGEWIAFLDADDLWPPDKLTCASALLARKPEADWIIGDFTNLRNDGVETTKLAVPCFEEDDRSGEPCDSKALTRSIILDGLHLGTCLIRRKRVGSLRFRNDVTYGEDLLFLAKLSVVARAHHAPGLSYICRRQHESMMYSPARLTARYASGPRAGMRDRDLRLFRRFYRWHLYDVYKDLAANNVLNRRRVAGLRFALSALWLDPQELRDFARFLHLVFARERCDLGARARLYSKREQYLL